jgi:hypothetical protein
MATMLTIDGEQESFDALAMPLPGAPRHPRNDRFECWAGKMRGAADAHIARLVLNLTWPSPLKGTSGTAAKVLPRRRRVEQAGIGPRTFPRTSQGR